MTGQEHYVKAEEHLARAAQQPQGGSAEQYCLAAAQVHATLALAAATGPVSAPPIDPATDPWATP